MSCNLDTTFLLIKCWPLICTPPFTSATNNKKTKEKALVSGKLQENQRKKCSKRNKQKTKNK